MLVAPNRISTFSNSPAVWHWLDKQQTKIPAHEPMLEKVAIPFGATNGTEMTHFN